jgi:hypothetical protein
MPGLEKQGVVAFANVLANKLAAYQTPTLDEGKKRFVTLYTIEYKGKITKRYTEVLDTLKKLEQIGCLEIHEDEVRITRIGKNVV